jgi:hypothetical protein
VLILEGRIAGPYAVELGRVWTERAPQLVRKKFAIDISNVTYADDCGVRVLREIYSETLPNVVANTPWTRHLAEQIAANPEDRENRSDQEHGNADND